MKYEIIDNVSRFVKRFGMIMDTETMKKSVDESADYDFRMISEDHYAVQHGDKMYVIIEREGEIGCSCEDMAYNRMDGSVCKHIIAFVRIMTPVTKPIDDADRAFLTNACGWTGADDKLHPGVELGEPGAVVQENVLPDPELDLGVSDPLPGCVTQCGYCGMNIAASFDEDMLLAVEAHEAICPKNPAKKTDKAGEAVVAENATVKTEPKEEKNMDKPAWDQAAWDAATQGSFVSYGEDGVAEVLFTSNDFEIGKLDQYNRTPREFSVIQNNTSVILSIGSLKFRQTLEKHLPLEGKKMKISRTGEGTGTKYAVEEVI